MKSRRTCVTESLLSALHGDNPCRIVLCGASGASHGCSVTGHDRKGRFRLRCCGNECDTTATAPVRADNPRRADRIVWLFDPKAPNEGRTAGLLTRSGRHAFPSPAGGSGGDCAAFVVEVTATGIVPELHRRSLFIPPPHDAAARNRHPLYANIVLLQAPQPFAGKTYQHFMTSRRQRTDAPAERGIPQ